MKQFLFRTCTASSFQSIITMMLFALVLGVGHAQVRSSTNYQLESDSVNIGGGLSSSTNYVQESTAGEIATGRSTSSSYQLRAGYQQMQESFTSLSLSTSSIVMGTAILGLTGGTSNGSTTVTVITDNGAGYQLSIVAQNTPAMQRLGGGETIADYTPAGGVPDFVFTTAGGAAHLGFTPEGVDVADRFLDDGGVCGTSTGNASLSCWDGLSTTAVAIAESSAANQPTGATTTVNFRVGIGSSAGVIAGEYVATSTVTALPL